MAGILHVVQRSPFQHASMEHCLAVLTPQQDALLLIGEGVYALLANTAPCLKLIAAREAGVRLHVLLPDMAARGLAEKSLPEGVQGIDYEGWVALVEAYATHTVW